jgi:hypothetical protein
MSLLCLHATGMPAVAAPWSALQKGMRFFPFPVEGVLADEE